LAWEHCWQGVGWGNGNLRHWAGLLRLVTAPIFACLMIPVLPFALVGYFGRSFLMGGALR
jgi:hypothetical protein